MKKSKVALAVALSAGLLAGCDFDVGPENSDSSGGDGGGQDTTVYSIENTYWDMTGGVNTAQTLSGTAPYFFANDEGSRSLKIYTGDAISGFLYSATSYSAEEGKVSFDGNDCTYTVEGSTLDMTCSKDGVDTSYTGSEIEDQTIISALDEAELDPDSFPQPVNEFSFTGEDNLFVDTGSAGDEMKLNPEDAKSFSSAAGVFGDANTAGKLDQDIAQSYLKISTPTGAQSITESFTVEAMIKQTARGDNSYYGDDVSIFEFYDKDTENGDFETGFKFYIEGDDDDSANLNAIKMKLYCGSENSEAKTEGGALANDQWQHVMAVYDYAENSTLLYINGKLEATKQLSCTPLVNGNSEDYVSMLGGSTSSDKNFNGLADNIALWDVALTADQIAERYLMLSDPDYVPTEPSDPEDELPVDPVDPVVVTDNFDSYTINAQINNANSAYIVNEVDGSTNNIAKVSDTVGIDGSLSLYLEDNNGDGSSGTKPVVSRYFKEGIAETGSVSTSVYIPENGYVKSTYLYLGTSESASSSARFTEIVFGSNSVKYRDQDTSQIDLADYDRDTWVDVTVSWAPDGEGKYDVTVKVDDVTYTSYVNDLDETVPFKAENDTGAPTLFGLYVGDSKTQGTYSFFDNLDSDLF